MIQQLPEEFLSRMKDMLQEEYPAFMESYQNPRHFGLRVNTKKISVEDFLKISPFHLTPVPWIRNGFYYAEEDRPSRHPHYAAGLYYLQEPSAMTPADRFPVKPGEFVLDLCAAPGGKATELGAKLQGEGLLVANDLSASRARALLRNLELCGIPNTIVTNETPARLSQYFPEFFHKILVDAPCSGEGMFRKDPEVAKTWDPSRPAAFARTQREILSCAVSMLKPGGKLLYSTCTFSPEENEEVIGWLLAQFPQMRLLPIAPYEGFSKGTPAWGNGDPRLETCVRIFPHHMDGEGHFLAFLEKSGDLVSSPSLCRAAKPDRAQQKLLEEFFQDVAMSLAAERIEVRNQNVYYLPQTDTHALKGLHFLRNGLFLGELKKNRFEPSQPFALALSMDQYASVLNLSSSDERVSRYLKGETILTEPGECTRAKGWQLVCTDGYPLGWGKLVGQTLKNKYPAGWRKNS